MNRPVLKSLTWVATTIVAASLFAYYVQPAISNTPEAVDLIITVFSILAGFLIAILGLIGDPSVMLPGVSWRAYQKQKPLLLLRMKKQKLLFYAYIITLALIFVSFLISSENRPELKCWLERSYLFIGFISFVSSLRLPTSLVRSQTERIDSLIEHKRREAGIKPNT